MTELAGRNADNFLSALIAGLNGGPLLVVSSPGDDGPCGTSLMLRLSSEPIHYAGVVVATVAAGSEAAIIDDLAARLAELGGPFSAIFCEAGLPALSLDRWFGALRRLGGDRAPLVGIGVSGGDFGSALFDSARRHHVSLQAGDSFWYATAQPTPISVQFASNIGGTIQPVHQISMAETLGTTGDRDFFLKASQAGIACRYHEGGGRPYDNPLPRNYSSVDEMQAELRMLGGYRSSGLSDGPAISFLTDVTMSGRIGLLYSSSNGMYDESYTTGKELQEPYRRNVHDHDHFLIQGKIQLADASAPHLGSVFPATRHRIEQPVVMINSWDLWCYNHWVNYTLSRFWYLDAFPELRDLPIVMGPITKKFQADYLDMLGLGEATIFQHHQTASLSLAGAYHPTLVDPPHFSPGCIAWLRGRFLRHAAAVPADYRSGRYYITRRNAESRQALNEDEIIGILSRFGFQIVDFAEFSVREQIALMQHAEVVVGYHGSSLTNVIFASPGCKVIDLTVSTEFMAKSSIGAMDPAITFAPAAFGVDYSVMVADPSDPPDLGQANFRYDTKRLASLLEQALGRVAS